MKLKSKLTDSDNINEKSFTESVYDFDESDWNGEDTTELFFKEDSNNSDNIVNNGNSTSRTMQAESDAKKKQIELNNTKYNGSNDKTNTQSQQLASLEHDKDGANKKTINKINKAKMLTIKNNMNDNKPVTEDVDIIDS